MLIRKAVAKIAKDGSITGVIDLAGYALCGIQMPAAWTAADLTFQVSHDGQTFADLYDHDDNEVAVKVDAARFIQLNPQDWLGVRFLKIRSGSAQTPTTQDAERIIVLVTHTADSIC